MNKKEAVERVKKLRREIDNYRYAYHVLDKSLISDEILDSLKKELYDIEQQYPELITPDSPTQRVGGKPLDGFKKVRHETQMLSFNDAFSEEDITAWFERIENYLKRRVKQEFYIELKIDGLAIELIYEDGILVQGVTRGDGIIGEDVTQNLKTVESIPLRLRDGYPRRLIVRGEIFLSKKEFNRINREQAKAGKQLYANPRNIAAGSIRQLDPKIAASRKLDSIMYNVVTDLGLKKHAQEHELLEKLGFKTNNKNNKVVDSLDEVFLYHKYWIKHREKLPWQIDGIVVIVNDGRVFKDAGVVGKTPRGAIAYKFPPEEVATIVEDIKIQVGRTGALTPVAVLKPINVGGVQVSHATLHNFDQIERLDVRVGDTVIVSRAGDVIPQITEVLKKLRTGKEKKFKVPKQCPIDGSAVVKEGAIYRCGNPDCGARFREELSHFVSRAAFDIRGLGPRIIDIFIENGLISDSADIFLLRKDDISSLPGFGIKSAENIIDEINIRKKIALPRFIYSLGILHIGEEMSYLLSKELLQNGTVINKPTQLIEVLGGFSRERLEEIDGIGPKVAESIYRWFRKDVHIKLLEKLESVGISIEGQEVSAEKLSGKSFVLTGTLSSISRDIAKQKIRELGGNVSESVAKDTDYLVVGDNPGSKLNKAKELDVEIIDEEKFLSLIGDDKTILLQ